MRVALVVACVTVRRGLPLADQTGPQFNTPRRPMLPMQLRKITVARTTILNMMGFLSHALISWRLWVIG